MAISVAVLRNRYFNIMTEIRQRIDVITGVYKESKRLPPFASRELVYIQMRMICELIGLACLTAHGNMERVLTKNVYDAYEPGKIFSHLETLHPLFYPIPVEQKLADDGSLEAIIPNRSLPHLKKDEVPKLHAICGQFLHQGSIGKFDANKEWDYKESAQWVNKIIGLLNRHAIVLADKRRVIYVMMQTKETGKVGLLDFEAADTSHWPAWFQELQEGA